MRKSAALRLAVASFAVLLCVAALSACGRGGSSSSNTPPTQSSNWGELEWGTGTWSD